MGNLGIQEKTQLKLGISFFKISWKYNLNKKGNEFNY